MEDKELKRQRVYKVIMLVVVSVFITFIVTSISMYTYFSENGNNTIINKLTTKNDIASQLEKYRSIIDKYYLGDIDENALIEGAIKGYVEALGDPYTEYISKEDMESYKEDILGNFVGIGIYMVKDTENNKIMVLTPISESPAEKAGILPGDFITKVDGIEYTAEDLTEISTKIKGEEGTTVKLEIVRDDKTLEFEIVRERINTNPIKSEVLENDIGYIKISSFDENTSSDFKEKFEELEKKNIKSLIIDLRNNGGGIVEEATTIADYIADKGAELLITVDKNGKEEIEKSKQEPIINMPIVVLVNENTASASEILAGALKDLEKATIVGTQTYGKGVIQNFLTMTDGSGIKITSEEYYTPNRTKINKIGIEPNEIVELPKEVTNILYVTEEQDTQLKKAIEILK